MDTIKVLLGMTVALLVGALAMSWKNYRQEFRDTPKKEMAEVQRQIAEIRQQRKQLEDEKERMMQGMPLTPKAAPSEKAPAIPEVASQDVPETGAVFGQDLPPQEVTPDTPDKPVASPEDRAKAIAAAPAVAKITEWLEDPNFGAFATLQVIDAAAVKVDSLLCVRRGTGILGKLKVSEVTPEGAVASPSAVFGDVKPKGGDEVIVEPVVP